MRPGNYLTHKLPEVPMLLVCRLSHSYLLCEIQIMKPKMKDVSSLLRSSRALIFSLTSVSLVLGYLARYISMVFSLYFKSFT